MKKLTDMQVLLNKYFGKTKMSKLEIMLEYVKLVDKYEELLKELV
jgi:hypothetical protein